MYYRMFVYILDRLDVGKVLKVHVIHGFNRAEKEREQTLVLGT